MNNPNQDDKFVKEIIEYTCTVSYNESFEKRIDRLFNQKIDEISKRNQRIPLWKLLWRSNMICKPAIAFTSILLIIAFFMINFTSTQTSLAQTQEVIKSASTMIAYSYYYDHKKRRTPVDVRYWESPNKLRIDHLGFQNRNDSWWIDGDSVTLVNHQTKSATIAKNFPKEKYLMGRTIADSEKLLTPEGIANIFSIQWSNKKTVWGFWRTLVQYQAYGEKNLPYEQLTALIDPSTHLPVLIRWKYENTHSYSEQNLQWNKSIKSTVFEPVIPGDYKTRFTDGSVKQEPMLVEPGIGVGEIKLNMKREQVLQLWGIPEVGLTAGVRFPETQISSEIYVYLERGVRLMLTGEDGVVKIDCILGSTYGNDICKDFTGKTKDGAELGITEQELIKALGQPLQRDERDVNGKIINMDYPQNFHVRLMNKYSTKGDDVPRVSSIWIESQDNPWVDGGATDF